MTFQKALAFSLAREGGYVNDPNDPGGETKFGISKRAHSDVDIANLTEEQASQIYWDDYWEGTAGALSNGSQMDALQAALFDFAIHSGSDRAIEELQKIVGTTVDGRIGPLTRVAAQRKAFELLALDLCDQRREFLHGVARRNAAMKKYTKGWIRRVSLLEAALQSGEFDADDD